MAAELPEWVEPYIGPSRICHGAHTASFHPKAIWVVMPIENAVDGRAPKLLCAAHLKAEVDKRKRVAEREAYIVRTDEALTEIQREAIAFREATDADLGLHIQRVGVDGYAVVLDAKALADLTAHMRWIQGTGPDPDHTTRLPS